MGDFGWDYPPGVTGNEPQISGRYPCMECGAALSDEPRCPDCDVELEWVNSCDCGWSCPQCHECFGGAR